MTQKFQLFFFVFCSFVEFVVNGNDFMRVCYFTNWSSKRVNVASRFHLGDIEPELCTHLVYAFATIDPNKRRLIKTEADDDNGSLDNKQGRYFDFTNLKKKYPHLKTMLSVGGQNTKGLFEGTMDSSESIKQFAYNIRIYLVDRNFDGIDIDWEYPAKFYKDRFIEFLEALREDFDQYALEEGHSKLLLSIAGAPGIDDINTSYNISQISRYVDFINVMAYDYYGKWSDSAGYNSPLYTNDPKSTLSQNWTMNYYMKLGAPAHKLVMGINAAAVGLVLKRGSDNKPGAPVKKGGVAKGAVLQVPGRRSYQEMCSVLRSGGYSEHWDKDHVQTYAVKGDQWFGYETERSVKAKVEYAMNSGLGGVMFWSLDIDDFTGNYCKRGRYPLLTAISKTSLEYKPVVTKPSQTQKSSQHKPIVTAPSQTQNSSQQNKTIVTEPSQTKNSSLESTTVASGPSETQTSTAHVTHSYETFPIETTTERRGGFRMFYVIDSSTQSKASFALVFCLLVYHAFLK